MENKVYLRALELEDYQTTITWRNDDEIWEMVGGPKYFVSYEYEKNWISKAISNTNDLRLGVCLKENDLLIGLVTLYQIDWINRSGRISAMIGDKNYWRSGYATDSMKLLLDFCFNERSMERLWTIILESNIPSQKVAAKCGASLEGVLRNAIYKNGKYHNQVIMSILRDEYINLKKRPYSE